MKNLLRFLQSGDLRSIGKVKELIGLIKTQADFDILFAYLSSGDRLVTMRAADAVEKITIDHPEFLKPYKKQVLALCADEQQIELKWHLALLLPRLRLTVRERAKVWGLLSDWVRDKRESKIVRVNALQGLADLLPEIPDQQADYERIITALKLEQIPSLNARMRKITVAIK